MVCTAGLYCEQSVEREWPALSSRQCAYETQYEALSCPEKPSNAASTLSLFAIGAADGDAAAKSEIGDTRLGIFPLSPLHMHHLPRDAGTRLAPLLRTVISVSPSLFPVPVLMSCRIPLPGFPSPGIYHCFGKHHAGHLIHYARSSAQLLRCSNSPDPNKHFIYPPPEGSSSATLTWHVNDVVNITWVSNFDNINLILWSNDRRSDGTNLDNPLLSKVSRSPSVSAPQSFHVVFDPAASAAADHAIPSPATGKASRVPECLC